MLDVEDKMCMGYGLSMFDTLINAVKRYKHIFQRSRKHQKAQFVEDKGDFIAKVEQKKQDGVCGPSATKTGHFTIHEYMDCDLKNIKEV